MSTGAPEQHVSDRVLTVPNALSAARLLGVPVFLWAILTERDGLALVLLFLAGLTDYLDGKIARQYDLVSRVGQLLDPVADRLYIVSTLLGLAWREIIPWWLVAVLFAREVFMGVVVLDRQAARLARPARCTSSARPRRSTCSTPSRCCCSARATARWPPSPQPIGWALRVVGHRRSTGSPASCMPSSCAS